MKIAYKKRHLNINLILGIVWLILGLLDMVFNEDLYWIHYGSLIVGILYLILYFYQKTYKYVTIENGIISLDGPFGKKLKLNEIKQIKTFAGDYILKADKKEIGINSKVIDPKAHAKLKAELEKLNVEWN